MTWSLSKFEVFVMDSKHVAVDTIYLNDSEMSCLFFVLVYECLVNCNQILMVPELGTPDSQSVYHFPFRQGPKIIQLQANYYYNT
jgi:hypothetical protein